MRACVFAYVCRFVCVPVCDQGMINKKSYMILVRIPRIIHLFFYFVFIR